MKYDIESILEMYEDDYTPSAKVPGPRNMKLAEVPRSEMDNFNTPDLDQGADSILKPGQTLEDDFDVEFRRPNAQGGVQQLVRNTVDGSRPGYSGKPPTTKHLGNGVYELTHERGSKTYYGKYERNKKSFKKSFGNDKEAAENFVKEGKKTPVAKNVIDIQSESGTLLEQPKYKANLTKALDEVTALQEKGYGNIDKIVKKYQKIFTQKIGSKTKAGKIIKTGTGSTEYKAITFAINEHAKKLGIQSIDNANVVKALDAYSKIKNPKRGNIPKILKKFNVPEGSFSKYLNTLNLRKKIPLQFGSEVAKKKYYAKIRNDAIREFSSNKFEKFLIAPETALVQKSHMGDLYNQYVRTGNLGYAPNLINQETLKTVDTTLKDYNEQINDLLKNKPKGYRAKVDLLNQQGNDLAAATQGYKKFTGKDPFTGKEFTLNFSKPSQELDPTNLLGNKKLSDLTAADKPTLEMLKEDAIKNAKLSKTKTNKISKEILSQLEKLGCGKAAGGRIMFGEGTSCAIKGRDILEKGLKNGFKKSDVGLAQKILGSGKFLKDAVSLRGLFGPAALAFTAAAEAGIVGYDMLSTGKSFKEAVGDSVFNYALGDKTKIDPVKERNKRMMEEGMTPEQMGKIGAMESAVDELNTFGSQFNKLDAIQKNRDAIDMSSEDTFNKNAFQLDLDRQENEARENIQDFNRTGGPQRLQGIDYAGGFENLAEGLRKNELAQLQSVDNPLQSRKGDEKRAARKRELMLQNPDVRNYMGSYPTNYGFMQGGIASLNVKK